MKNIDDLIPYNLIIKIVIYITSFTIAFYISLFILNNAINNEESDKIKIYFKGMVVNPESFYLSSLNFYNSGRYQKADREINFALGLIGYKCSKESMKICDLKKEIEAKKSSSYE